MPHKFSATFVRSVRPAGGVKTYGDGRGGYGLTLCVMPNGVKYWYQRIRIRNRHTNIGLGGYPLVTLAEARTAALENAHEARAGGDPRRQRPTVPTVAQVAEAVIARDAPTWRDTRNAMKRWRSSLERTRHPSCRCRWTP